MTEHPLLLSTPMVLAFLSGRKRVSRRIPTCTNSLVDGRRVSGKTWKDYDFDMTDYVIDPGPSPAGNSGPYFKIRSRKYDTRHRIYPIYQSGDVLWFRETYLKPPEITNKMLRDGADTWPEYDYLASCSETEIEQYKEWGWKIKPSIHMPKAACRLWADCGAVTCEHLQDITEEQAEAEGVDKSFAYEIETPDGGQSYVTHRAAFKRLWERIHGPLTWSLNPPVYAINFNPTTRKP